MGAPPQASARRRGGLMFPVVLLVVGMMFLADHLVPGWGLRKTWPVLLIVIGVVKLLNVFQPPRPPEGPRV